MRWALLILPGLMYAAGQPAVDSASGVRLAIKLAAAGQCSQALAILHKASARTLDQELRRNAELARVRCAIALNQTDDAAEAIRGLTREYPADPEVLYLAVHVYSDLSIRASQDLLYRAPASPQVHQLNAEAMETQGKWAEAADEYRAVLSNNPEMAGIHYRLGRLILSQPRTAATVADARKEFEAELQVNAANAGAEFILGELARQADENDDAVAHFSRAAKLDAGFGDAYLGLGQSLLAENKNAEAIPALENAVKLRPDNPETHFQLAKAYQRTGRTTDAAREMAAHQEATDRARQKTDNLQKAVSGRQ